METNLITKFAAAAIHGTASSALESEFIAQRAWDIAREMVKQMPQESLEKNPNKFETPNNNEALMEKKFGKNSEVQEKLNGELIDLIDAKGKSTDQILKESTLTYPQLIYQLKRLEEKGKIKADKAIKPYLWRLPKRAKIDKKEVNDSIFEKKLAFARSLGFDNITDAVSKEGPFEFTEKFETWKTGN